MISRQVAAMATAAGALRGRPQCSSLALRTFPVRVTGWRRRCHSVWTYPNSSHPFIRDPARHKLVDEMLRVDQAGEVAAIEIYAGQLWMLRGSNSEPLLRDMQRGEEVHLRTLNHIAASRRVRPTALMPLWRAAGFVLGAGSAALGKEAAMACTVAVETVIGEHYNDQIRELLKQGYSDEQEITSVFKQHRDEELGHLDTALLHDAERAPFYGLLTAVIKVGCRAAVAVARKI